MVTAQDFLIENGESDFRLSRSGINLSEIMIEFAKFHVTEALKAASENALLLEQSNWGKYEQSLEDKNPNYINHKIIKKNNFGHGDCTYQILTVNKQSILNAYNINEIK